MSHRPGRALLVDLAAFPEPPTFIPVSPATPAFPAPPASPNPPPSRPPAAPLPPVPGPSRISDTDTLLFLQSTAPSRSRRSSRLSNRDSVASNRSDSLLSVSTGSLRSSPQTPSSAAQSLHSPSLAFSIDEHAELPDDLLESTPLQDIQKAPLDDDDDLALDDLTVSVPPVMPSSSAHRAARSTPPRTSTPRRESIALSSVAIPTTDSDTEPDFDALTPAQDLRAPSPDIQSILATTPRPRLSSISRRQTPQPYDEPWEEDFIDDYGHVRGSSIYSAASKASGPYAFGYPEQDDPDGQSLDGDDDHMLWDEPNDSDSDIDLHTSLPQLMLHHGFLSPRSKLVSNAASSASLALPSPASAAFPSTDSLLRDTRDTPKRRVRHRDGKTLRGGIGLTTGLGWSDSEDEDAPSALTRRISSLNLNRSSSHLGLSRASSFSMRSSTYSSAQTTRTRRAQSESQGPADVDEFGAWAPRKPSGGAPPTSWTRRSEPSARLSRAQSQSSLGPHITRTPSIRTDDSAHTTTSAGSAMSLPLMRSRSRVLRVMMADKEKPLPRTPSLRRNPSTASNLGPTPSRLRPRAATGVSASSLPQAHSAWSPTPLSMQSTPQAGPPPASAADAPPMPAPAPTTLGAKSQMRPLRLQPRPPVLGGDRAPVPVPAVLNVGGLTASSTVSSLASSASASSALSASTSATSVSLLSPSPSYASRSPSPGYAAQGFPRGPPSPGFAPGTPTTPTTPMYETGVVRPRVGAGMKYRSSTMYSAPPARGLPVRAPAKAVAL